MKSATFSGAMKPITSVLEAWDRNQNKLKILLVVSTPIDESVKINPIREIEDLYRELSWARLPATVILLSPPTWQRLYSTLVARSFDIVHFIGHARPDAIQLEREDGTADWISSSELSKLFSETSVKVVFLNNCSSENIGDSLIPSNVPVVVATTRAISTRIALDVSKNFYSIIASGESFGKISEIVDDLMRHSTLLPNEEPIISIFGPGRNDLIWDTPLEPGEPNFYTCEPLNNLPPLFHELFVGREQELLGMYELLTSSNSPFIGLYGIAGTGKSTIAKAAAWKFAWRFANGIAYASLRQMRPFNLPALFSHFNWGIEELRRDKQLSAILHELSKGPILILLDDLEVATPQDIGEIVNFLSKWDTRLGGRAILTMRSRRKEFDPLVHANWLNINLLPYDAAVELLCEQIGGVEKTKSLMGSRIKEVTKLCHRHPKLLILTASALQLGIPLEELMSQLRKLRVGEIAEVLQQTIEAIEQESPIAGQFLDCWPVFADFATEEAWRYVTSAKQQTNEDPLRELQNDALAVMQRSTILERHPLRGSNLYSCTVHPMIAEYLQSHRWDNLSETKKEKYERLHIEYYISSMEDQRENFPISQERNNILLALKRGVTIADSRLLLSLCKILVGDRTSILIKNNLWDFASETLNIAIATAQKLPEKNWQATFLNNLGKIKYRLAEYSEAQQAFRETLSIAEDIGDNNLTVEVTREIGRVYYRLAEYENARQHFLESLNMAKSVNDPSDIAEALDELGRLSYREKKLDKAEEYLLESLKIRENLSPGAGLGRTLLELGRVYHSTSRMDIAKTTYERSLKVRKRIGDTVGLQSTLIQIGKLYQDLNEHEKAIEAYTQNTEISNALNDRFWIAHNQFYYGSLLWQKGDCEKATSLIREALETCKLLNIRLANTIEDWLVEHNLS